LAATCQNKNFNGLYDYRLESPRLHQLARYAVSAVAAGRDETRVAADARAVEAIVFQSLLTEPANSPAASKSATGHVRSRLRAARTVRLHCTHRRRLNRTLDLHDHHRRMREQTRTWRRWQRLYAHAAVWSVDLGKGVAMDSSLAALHESHSYYRLCRVAEKPAKSSSRSKFHDGTAFHDRHRPVCDA
jgi:hypothetical protein